VTPSVGRVPSAATSSPTISLSATIVTRLQGGTMAASGIVAWVMVIIENTCVY
jgi:hypothetical protein